MIPRLPINKAQTASKTNILLRRPLNKKPLLFPTPMKQRATTRNARPAKLGNVESKHSVLNLSGLDKKNITPTVTSEDRSNVVNLIPPCLETSSNVVYANLNSIIEKSPGSETKNYIPQKDTILSSERSLQQQLSATKSTKASIKQAYKSLDLVQGFSSPTKTTKAYGAPSDVVKSGGRHSSRLEVKQPLTVFPGVGVAKTTCGGESHAAKILPSKKTLSVDVSPRTKKVKETSIQRKKRRPSKTRHKPVLSLDLSSPTSVPELIAGAHKVLGPYTEHNNCCNLDYSAWTLCVALGEQLAYLLPHLDGDSGTQSQSSGQFSLRKTRHICQTLLTIPGIHEQPNLRDVLKVLCIEMSRYTLHPLLLAYDVDKRQLNVAQERTTAWHREVARKTKYARLVELPDADQILSIELPIALPDMTVTPVTRKSHRETLAKPVPIVAKPFSAAAKAVPIVETQDVTTKSSVNLYPLSNLYILPEWFSQPRVPPHPISPVHTLSGQILPETDNVQGKVLHLTTDAATNVVDTSIKPKRLMHTRPDARVSQPLSKQRMQNSPNELGLEDSSTQPVRLGGATKTSGALSSVLSPTRRSVIPSIRQPPETLTPRVASELTSGILSIETRDPSCQVTMEHLTNLVPVGENNWQAKENYIDTASTDILVDKNVKDDQMLPRTPKLFDLSDSVATQQNKEVLEYNNQITNARKKLNENNEVFLPQNKLFADTQDEQRFHKFQAFDQNPPLKKIMSSTRITPQLQTTFISYKTPPPTYNFEQRTLEQPSQKSTADSQLNFPISEKEQLISSVTKGKPAGKLQYSTMANTQHSANKLDSSPVNASYNDKSLLANKSETTALTTPQDFYTPDATNVTDLNSSSNSLVKLTKTGTGQLLQQKPDRNKENHDDLGRQFNATNKELETTQYFIEPMQDSTVLINRNIKREYDPIVKDAYEVTSFRSEGLTKQTKMRMNVAAAEHGKKVKNIMKDNAQFSEQTWFNNEPDMPISSTKIIKTTLTNKNLLPFQQVRKPIPGVNTDPLILSTHNNNEIQSTQQYRNDSLVTTMGSRSFGEMHEIINPNPLQVLNNQINTKSRRSKSLREARLSISQLMFHDSPVSSTAIKNLPTNVHFNKSQSLILLPDQTSTKITKKVIRRTSFPRANTSDLEERAATLLLQHRKELMETHSKLSKLHNNEEVFSPRLDAVSAGDFIYNEDVTLSDYSYRNIIEQLPKIDRLPASKTKSRARLSYDKSEKSLMIKARNWLRDLEKTTHPIFPGETNFQTPAVLAQEQDASLVVQTLSPIECMSSTTESSSLKSMSTLQKFASEKRKKILNDSHVPVSCSGQEMITPVTKLESKLMNERQENLIPEVDRTFKQVKAKKSEPMIFSNTKKKQNMKDEVEYESKNQNLSGFSKQILRKNGSTQLEKLESENLKAQHGMKKSSKETGFILGLKTQASMKKPGISNRNENENGQHPSEVKPEQSPPLVKKKKSSKDTEAIVLQNELTLQSAALEDTPLFRVAQLRAPVKLQVTRSPPIYLKTLCKETEIVTETIPKVSASGLQKKPLIASATEIRQDVDGSPLLEKESDQVPAKSPSLTEIRKVPLTKPKPTLIKTFSKDGKVVGGDTSKSSAPVPIEKKASILTEVKEDLHADDSAILGKKTETMAPKSPSLTEIKKIPFTKLKPTSNETFSKDGKDVGGDTSKSLAPVPIVKKGSIVTEVKEDLHADDSAILEKKTETVPGKSPSLTEIKKAPFIKPKPTLNKTFSKDGKDVGGDTSKSSAPVPIEKKASILTEAEEDLHADDSAILGKKTETMAPKSPSLTEIKKVPLTKIKPTLIKTFSKDGKDVGGDTSKYSAPVPIEKKASILTEAEEEQRTDDSAILEKKTETMPPKSPSLTEIKKVPFTKPKPTLNKTFSKDGKDVGGDTSKSSALVPIEKKASILTEAEEDLHADDSATLEKKTETVPGKSPSLTEIKKAPFIKPKPTLNKTFSKDGKDVGRDTSKSLAPVPIVKKGSILTEVKEDLHADDSATLEKKTETMPPKSPSLTEIKKVPLTKPKPGLIKTFSKDGKDVGGDTSKSLAAVPIVKKGSILTEVKEDLHADDSAILEKKTETMAPKSPSLTEIKKVPLTKPKPTLIKTFSKDGKDVGGDTSKTSAPVPIEKKASILTEAKEDLHADDSAPLEKKTETVSGKSPSLTEIKKVPLIKPKPTLNKTFSKDGKDVGGDTSKSSAPVPIEKKASILTEVKEDLHADDSAAFEKKTETMPPKSPSLTEIKKVPLTNPKPGLIKTFSKDGKDVGGDTSKSLAPVPIVKKGSILTEVKEDLHADDSATLEKKTETMPPKSPSLTEIKKVPLTKPKPGLIKTFSKDGKDVGGDTSKSLAPVPIVKKGSIFTEVKEDLHADDSAILGKKTETMAPKSPSLTEIKRVPLTKPKPTLIKTFSKDGKDVGGDTSKSLAPVPIVKKGSIVTEAKEDLHADDSAALEKKTETVSGKSPSLTEIKKVPLTKPKPALNKSFSKDGKVVGGDTSKSSAPVPIEKKASILTEVKEDLHADDSAILGKKTETMAPKSPSLTEIKKIPFTKPKPALNKSFSKDGKVVGGDTSKSSAPVPIEKKASILTEVKEDLHADDSAILGKKTETMAPKSPSLTEIKKIPFTKPKPTSNETFSKDGKDVGGDTSKSLAPVPIVKKGSIVTEVKEDLHADDSAILEKKTETMPPKSPSLTEIKKVPLTKPKPGLIKTFSKDGKDVGGDTSKSLAPVPIVKKGSIFTEVKEDLHADDSAALEKKTETMPPKSPSLTEIKKVPLTEPKPGLIKTFSKDGKDVGGDTSKSLAPVPIVKKGSILTEVKEDLHADDSAALEKKTETMPSKSPSLTEIKKVPLTEPKPGLIKTFSKDGKDVGGDTSKSLAPVPIVKKGSILIEVKEDLHADDSAILEKKTETMAPKSPSLTEIKKVPLTKFKPGLIKTFSKDGKDVGGDTSKSSAPVPIEKKASILTEVKEDLHADDSAILGKKTETMAPKSPSLTEIKKVPFTKPKPGLIKTFSKDGKDVGGDTSKTSAPVPIEKKASILTEAKEDLHADDSAALGKKTETMPPKSPSLTEIKKVPLTKPKPGLIKTFSKDGKDVGGDTSKSLAPVPIVKKGSILTEVKEDLHADDSAILEKKTETMAPKSPSLTEIKKVPLTKPKPGLIKTFSKDGKDVGGDTSKSLASVPIVKKGSILTEVKEDLHADDSTILEKKTETMAPKSPSLTEMKKVPLTKPKPTLIKTFSKDGKDVGGDTSKTSAPVPIEKKASILTEAKEDLHADDSAALEKKTESVSRKSPSLTEIKKVPLTKPKPGLIKTFSKDGKDVGGDTSKSSAPVPIEKKGSILTEVKEDLHADDSARLEKKTETMAPKSPSLTEIKKVPFTKPKPGLIKTFSKDGKDVGGDTSKTSAPVPIEKKASILTEAKEDLHADDSAALEKKTESVSGKSPSLTEIKKVPLTKPKPGLIKTFSKDGKDVGGDTSKSSAPVPIEKKGSILTEVKKDLHADDAARLEKKTETMAPKSPSLTEMKKVPLTKPKPTLIKTFSKDGKDVGGDTSKTSAPVPIEKKASILTEAKEDLHADDSAALEKKTESVSGKSPSLTEIKKVPLTKPKPGLIKTFSKDGKDVGGDTSKSSAPVPIEKKGSILTEVKEDLHADDSAILEKKTETMAPKSPSLTEMKKVPLTKPKPTLIKTFSKDGKDVGGDTSKTSAPVPIEKKASILTEAKEDLHADDSAALEKKTESVSGKSPSLTEIKKVPLTKPKPGLIKTFSKDGKDVGGDTSKSSAPVPIEKKGSILTEVKEDLHADDSARLEKKTETMAPKSPSLTEIKKVPFTKPKPGLIKTFSKDGKDVGGDTSKTSAPVPIEKKASILTEAKEDLHADDSTILEKKTETMAPKSPSLTEMKKVPLTKPKPTLIKTFSKDGKDVGGDTSKTSAPVPIEKKASILTEAKEDLHADDSTILEKKTETMAPKSPSLTEMKKVPLTKPKPTLIKTFSKDGKDVGGDTSKTSAPVPIEKKASILTEAKEDLHADDSAALEKKTESVSGKSPSLTEIKKVPLTKPKPGLTKTFSKDGKDVGGDTSKSSAPVPIEKKGSILTEVKEDLHADDSAILEKKTETMAPKSPSLTEIKKVPLTKPKPGLIKTFSKDGKDVGGDTSKTSAPVPIEKEASILTEAKEDLHADDSAALEKKTETVSGKSPSLTEIKKAPFIKPKPTLNKTFSKDGKDVGGDTSKSSAPVPIEKKGSILTEVKEDLHADDSAILEKKTETMPPKSPSLTEIKKAPFTKPKPTLNKTFSKDGKDVEGDTSESLAPVPIEKKASILTEVKEDLHADDSAILEKKTETMPPKSPSLTEIKKVPLTKPKPGLIKTVSKDGKDVGGDTSKYSAPVPIEKKASILTEAKEDLHADDSAILEKKTETMPPKSPSLTEIKKVPLTNPKPGLIKTFSKDGKDVGGDTSKSLAPVPIVKKGSIFTEAKEDLKADDSATLEKKTETMPPKSPSLTEIKKVPLTKPKPGLIKTVSKDGKDAGGDTSKTSAFVPIVRKGSILTEAKEDLHAEDSAILEKKTETMPPKSPSLTEIKKAPFTKPKPTLNKTFSKDGKDVGGDTSESLAPVPIEKKASILTEAKEDLHADDSAILEKKTETMPPKSPSLTEIKKLPLTKPKPGLIKTVSKDGKDVGGDTSKYSAPVPIEKKASILTEAKEDLHADDSAILEKKTETMPPKSPSLTEIKKVPLTKPKPGLIKTVSKDGKDAGGDSSKSSALVPIVRKGSILTEAKEDLHADDSAILEKKTEAMPPKSPSLTEIKKVPFTKPKPTLNKTFSKDGKDVGGDTSKSLVPVPIEKKASILAEAKEDLHADDSATLEKKTETVPGKSPSLTEIKKVPFTKPKPTLNKTFSKDGKDVGGDTSKSLAPVPIEKKASILTEAKEDLHADDSAILEKKTETMPPKSPSLTEIRKVPLTKPKPGLIKTFSKDGKDVGGDTSKSLVPVPIEKKASILAEAKEDLHADDSATLEKKTETVPGKSPSLTEIKKVPFTKPKPTLNKTFSKDGKDVGGDTSKSLAPVPIEKKASILTEAKEDLHADDSAILEKKTETMPPKSPSLTEIRKVPLTKPKPGLIKTFSKDGKDVGGDTSKSLGPVPIEKKASILTEAKEDLKADDSATLEKKTETMPPKSPSLTEIKKVPLTKPKPGLIKTVSKDGKDVGGDTSKYSAPVPIEKKASILTEAKEDLHADDSAILENKTETMQPKSPSLTEIKKVPLTKPKPGLTKVLSKDGKDTGGHSSKSSAPVPMEKKASILTEAKEDLHADDSATLEKKTETVPAKSPSLPEIQKVSVAKPKPSFKQALSVDRKPVAETNSNTAPLVRIDEKVSSASNIGTNLIGHGSIRSNGNGEANPLTRPATAEEPEIPTHEHIVAPKVPKQTSQVASQRSKVSSDSDREKIFGKEHFIRQKSVSSKSYPVTSQEDVVLASGSTECKSQVDGNDKQEVPVPSASLEVTKYQSKEKTINPSPSHVIIGKSLPEEELQRLSFPVVEKILKTEEPSNKDLPLSQPGINVRRGTSTAGTTNTLNQPVKQDGDVVNGNNTSRNNISTYTDNTTTVDKASPTEFATEGKVERDLREVNAAKLIPKSKSNPSAKHGHHKEKNRFLNFFGRSEKKDSS